MSGGVTYNGRRPEEFAVRRTAGCMEQRDVHIPLLTVRETLDFAARCQGAAHRPGAPRSSLTARDPIPEP